jgi:predicted transcriptional regulator
VSAGEPLTESVRIRLSASEKQELEQRAAREDRSASALGRRAIRRELELLRKRQSKRVAGDAA